jgi:SnoaL-like domain
VSSKALDVVNRWRAANFERAAVEAVLTDDVEWIVPKGGGVTALHGIDAVLEWYERGGVADEGTPDESFDVSEERGELEDFGEGRVGSVNRVVYTSKESGEVAEVKMARLVYTVRNGKIARYELENLNDADRSAD